MQYHPCVLFIHQSSIHFFYSFLIRQGAHFVESWSDGFAFHELSQQQSCIVQQKEELERQRKLLAKKRTAASSSISGIEKIDERETRNLLFFLGKGKGGKQSPTQDGDGFTKPHTPRYQ